MNQKAALTIWSHTYPFCICTVYTENIQTFSSEFKVFLKLKQRF